MKLYRNFSLDPYGEYPDPYNNSNRSASIAPSPRIRIQMGIIIGADPKHCVDALVVSNTLVVVTLDIRCLTELTMDVTTTKDQSVHELALEGDFEAVKRVVKLNPEIAF